MKWLRFLPEATVALLGMSLVSFKQGYWAFTMVHLHPPETALAHVLAALTIVPFTWLTIFKWLDASLGGATSHRPRHPLPHWLLHLAFAAWGVSMVSVSAVHVALAPAHFASMAGGAAAALLLPLVGLGVYMHFNPPEQDISEVFENMFQDQIEYDILHGPH